jgi:hypothetical protein
MASAVCATETHVVAIVNYVYGGGTFPILANPSRMALTSNRSLAEIGKHSDRDTVL